MFHVLRYEEKSSEFSALEDSMRIINLEFEETKKQHAEKISKLEAQCKQLKDDMASTRYWTVEMFYV